MSMRYIRNCERKVVNMNLKKCILTRNDCYTSAVKMAKGKPTGIVVHSTGANNTSLKRYVQPLAIDSNYDSIVEDIGRNINNNHWNKSYKAGETNRQVCVHAFIGKNATNKIETYQTLPFDICCWGVGSGSKGSYNYNPKARIQFEICEDDLTDKTYFTAAFKEAAEFCAYLCNLYDLPVSSICSHAEAHKAGYGSNHSDPDHWLRKFGKTMNDFRKDVQSLVINGIRENKNNKSINVNNKNSDKSSYKTGDIVLFTGTKQYTSSYAHATEKSCKPGKATITDIVDKPTDKQLHLVHLKAIGGSGSTVNGWTNMSDIVSIATDNSSEEEVVPYLVRVTASSLNIRKGPGTNFDTNGTIKDGGSYTIVDVKTGVGATLWGKLKSGAGWISLDYVNKNRRV